MSETPKLFPTKTPDEYDSCGDCYNDRERRRIEFVAWLHSVLNDPLAEHGLHKETKDFIKEILEAMNKI